MFMTTEAAWRINKMLNTEFVPHSLPHLELHHSSLPPNLSSYEELIPVKNLAVGIYVLLIGKNHWPAQEELEQSLVSELNHPSSNHQLAFHQIDLTLEF